MNKIELYRFFEGFASDEEKNKIRAWVESSKENKDVFLKERKIFDTLILVGNQAQPHCNNKRKFNNYHILHEVLKIACIVLITMGVTISLFSIGNDHTEESMQAIFVPLGQRVNIDLPDGTNVWLNAGTTMRYPLSFSKNKREVMIDGEAYFDVKKNHESPFIVHTQTLKVKVLGTKFNVNASSTRHIFETSLIEGKVQVFSEKEVNDVITLLPNQKAIYHDGELMVSNIENFDEFRWKEGLFCFKDKSFNEILQNLERYYDVRFVVDENFVNHDLLTGKFRIVDGLDYALRVLQNNVRFKYYRDKESNVISINSLK